MNRLWRMRLVASGLLLLLVVCAGRSFELQVHKQDFLRAEGERRHVRVLVEPAERGAIRDRHGEVLALSAPSESIWVVPAALLEDADKIPHLARLLGRSESQLRKELEARAGRQFYYLARQQAPAAARRIMALGARGVFLQREYRRFYPGGEIAASLVGLTDIDGQGQEGLERSLDAQLRGEPGRRRVIQDSLGRVVEDLSDYVPAKPGQDVQLTLDSRLQHAAYSALKAVAERAQAQSGQALFVDVADASVLAAASWPGVNPNDRSDAVALRQGLRNRIAMDVFEPGSTVKPFVVAAALDQGLVDTDTTIATGNGYLRVNGQDIRDLHGYGDLSLGRVLAKSSNVGAVKLGLRLGPEALFHAYQGLGFGYLTGALSGEEASGYLPAPMELGSTVAAYGYGFNVTMLQLAQAWMALATDGRPRSLRFFMEEVLPAHEPAFSPETAAAVREMLIAVVAPGGTATQAAIPGWQVAGKTGTVRKVVNGRYDSERHQAFFVGMVPAHQPRVLGLIMLDDPGGDRYYGGQLAAPVFADVAGHALRRLGVAPVRRPALAQAQGGAS